MKFFAPDRQRQIYLSGFAGQRPVIPISFEAQERAVEKKLNPEAFAYIAGGAGHESTVSSNRRDFDKWHIQPRVLRNVSERDLSISMFGRKLPAPVLLSPIGVLELAHPQADLAVSRAAAALGVPFIFSNQASYPMEACAAEMGESPRWFQLYWSKSRTLIQSFLKRAEACGADAIVVTLDTTLLGWRTRDLDLAYLPFLEGKGIAQYTSDPVFQQMLDEPDSTPAPKRSVTWQTLSGLVSMVNRYPGNGFLKKLRSGKPMKAVAKFINTYSNPATTWNDLDWLRQQTTLPILLKGILHADDACMAVDRGMNGVVVSNHGGRQVDGSISSVCALPSIVHAVNGRIPVLFDSGVRCGADIFKALALGASAVCVGRPYVYGLALAGEQGVVEVMHNLVSDFELTMALSGCCSIADIGRELLVQAH